MEDRSETPSASPLSCSPSSSIASSTSLFHFEHDRQPKQRDTSADVPKATTVQNAANAEGPQKGRKEEEQDFNPERYLLWHKRVLLHRARVGSGRSHEMQRLYNFWSQFLIDNFNDAMYQAFKRYAEEDASAGHTFGLTCLFHFFFRFLSQDFETEIYKDFETLALKYQDYLGVEEGMDCLCHFLAGVSAAQGQQLVSTKQCLSTASSCGTPSAADSTPTSVSAGMLLVPPGLTREAGVEVDSRVLEQLQAWQLTCAAAALNSQFPDSLPVNDVAPSDSLTGSSEAGGDGDQPTSMLPKRLGRRPNGKLVQAMRRASARCTSPSGPGHFLGSSPSSVLAGTSPPVSGVAHSCPNGSIISRAAANTSAPGSGRVKRARQPKTANNGSRRGSNTNTAGLMGTSPAHRGQPAPSTSAPHSVGGRRHQAPGYSWPSEGFGQAVRAGGRARTLSEAQSKGVERSTGRGDKGADCGVGGDGDVPLWEAQPCGVTCGASAELAKALPLRLGELFGD